MKNILFFIGMLFLVHEPIAQDLYINLQKGHGAAVKSLELSTDGKFLFTGSRDKSIKMWDVQSGLEIKSFFSHESTINDLSIGKNSNMLASSSADLTIKLWDVKKGENVWTSPQSKEYMTAVALSPDGRYVAVGGYDDIMVVYDIKTKDSVVSLAVESERGKGFGISLEWSEDGKWLAIGEDNRSLSLYSTESWELKYKLKPEKGWCGGCPTFIAFHPNNQQFAKLSDNGSLDLINIESGKVTFTLQENLDDIRSIEFNSSGTLLLAATKEQIFIYSLPQNSVHKVLNPDVIEINEVIFDRSSDAVIVAGNDNKASLVDIASGNIIRQFQGLLHDQDKGGIMYDPNNYWESNIARYIHHKNQQSLTSDGQYLLKGKIGSILRMWEVKSGKAVMEYVGHEKTVVSFDISPDEKMIASGGGSGKIIIWEKNSGKQLMSLEGHNSPVFDLCWSQNQKQLVSTSWDGKVLVWDIASGKIISRIYWDNLSAYAVSFTSDDLYLIVARLDQKLELYEVATGQLVKSFIGHTRNVNELLLTDKPEEFISLSDDGTAILWNIYDGMIRKKYSHPKGSIRAALLNKEKIYTGGEDKIIRIWNRKSNELLLQLEGHQSTISSLNINQDASLLISGDLDGVTKFWDLKTGQEILEHVIVDRANWMARNPKGYFYATEGAKKYIHYVKGNDAFFLDQFFEDFYTPDLISDTFSEKSNKNRKSLQGLLEKSFIPEVKIAGFISDDQLSAKLFIKVYDLQKSIAEIQLFHNGKRLGYTLNDFKITKEADKSITYEAKEALVSGHNRFKVKVINKEKIESAAAEVDLLAENNIPGATCHVLAIGLNEYKNSKLNLNYAVADAKSFAAQIEGGIKGLFSDFKLYQLHNENATKANILAALDSITLHAAIDDLFVFYFAGHGSMNDEAFYFIPYESTRLYDENSLKKQALSALEVQKKLTQLKALKQIVIIDACQSGGSVELLSQRGAIEEKAIAQLSRSAGVHIMSAAGSQQFASEFAELGHGLFTYILLEALAGDADRSPNDGRLTVYEMKSFLDEKVPELNMRLKGKPQYPYTFSRGNDFPIGLTNGSN